MVLNMYAVVFTVGIICSPCTSTGARGFVTMFTTSDFRLGRFSFLFGTLGLACFGVRFLSYKTQFNCKFYNIIKSTILLFMTYYSLFLIARVPSNHNLLLEFGNAVHYLRIYFKPYTVSHLQPALWFTRLISLH